jgi:hypothetical protein
LSADDPGYGFVGPGIPELTIGVAALWRGQGIKRRFCNPSPSRPGRLGFGRLASVPSERKFALQLYLSEG